MTRLDRTFERLRAEGRCGLFPYLTAGFPDLASSRELARVALEVGADGFEIGVPFSDPLADGATLQRANARALEAGASLETALDLARFIREQSPETPIALMSYVNPLLRRGLADVAEALASIGADAAIVPDVPAEEGETLRGALESRGLDLVQMLAPTSGEARIERIAALGRGFIYCVALVGVTGARTELSSNLGSFLGEIRARTQTPLVVGFGISRPEHVQEVSALGADGVIVASALADLVEKHLADDPLGAARSYLSEMKSATRREVAV